MSNSTRRPRIAISTSRKTRWCNIANSLLAAGRTIPPAANAYRVKIDKSLTRTDYFRRSAEHLIPIATTGDAPSLPFTVIPGLVPGTNSGRKSRSCVGPGPRDKLGDDARGRPPRRLQVEAAGIRPMGYRQKPCKFSAPQIAGVGRVKPDHDDEEATTAIGTSRKTRWRYIANFLRTAGRTIPPAVNAYRAKVDKSLTRSDYFRRISALFPHPRAAVTLCPGRGSVRHVRLRRLHLRGHQRMRGGA